MAKASFELGALHFFICLAHYNRSCCINASYNDGMIRFHHPAITYPAVRSPTKTLPPVLLK
jgi:hypothetical protein